jgi:predicted amidohydrolase
LNNRKFKIALLQMKVEGGQRTKNLFRAGAKIAEAARAGAQIVLLPEAFDLGWTHPTAKNQAQPVPAGKTSLFLCKEAEKFALYVCAGLIEKQDEHIYNTALLISPNGQIILKHRKINELDIGRQYYSVGSELSVCQTDYGKFGIIICADAKDPALLQKLGMQGVSVVLSPCSWAVAADHNNIHSPYGQEWIDAYSPAAINFSMWIAACSNVGWMNAGPWQGHKGIGCSLIVDSNGRVAAKGPYGVEAETIIFHTIHIP